MLRWIKVSVAISTADVASSSISRRGRERMARAKQRSCFCPFERLDPAAEMGELKELKMLALPLTSVSVTDLLLVDDSVACSGTGVLSDDGIRCTR